MAGDESDAILDDLDRALLAALLEDARLSYRELARRTGTTTPTASARVRRMEQIGIITGYTVRLDPQRFGQQPSRPHQFDLAAPVSLACHTCRQETTDPFWATVDGRRHPFCCTMCRTTYQQKHARLKGRA